MNDKKSLEHIGILGMKWGHRRGRSTSVVRKKPGADDDDNTSEDYKKKISFKGKTVKEMSNDELRTFNQRVVLEKQYKELTKTQLSPGRKFVQDLVLKQATKAVEQYLDKRRTQMVDDFLKRSVKETIKETVK